MATTTSPSALPCSTLTWIIFLPGLEGGVNGRKSKYLQARYNKTSSTSWNNDSNPARDEHDAAEDTRPGGGTTSHRTSSSSTRRPSPEVLVTPINMQMGIFQKRNSLSQNSFSFETSVEKCVETAKQEILKEYQTRSRVLGGRVGYYVDRAESSYDVPETANNATISTSRRTSSTTKPLKILLIGSSWGGLIALELLRQWTELFSPYQIDALAKATPESLLLIAPALKPLQHAYPVMTSLLHTFLPGDFENYFADTVEKRYLSMNISAENICHRLSASQTRIWLLHGDQDTVIDIEGSRQLFANLLCTATSTGASKSSMTNADTNIHSALQFRFLEVLGGDHRMNDQLIFADTDREVQASVPTSTSAFLWSFVPTTFAAHWGRRSTSTEARADSPESERVSSRGVVGHSRNYKTEGGISPTSLSPSTRPSASEGEVRGGERITIPLRIRDCDRAVDLRENKNSMTNDPPPATDEYCSLGDIVDHMIRLSLQEN
ncbi:unnamed protein product [Amoebophrya sp. A120]|nr:unnamed protein product [Amoebophrya sp. A120]|eukprot:GSA120T00025631001.1